MSNAPSFNARLSDPFAKVFDSVHWLTLEHLCLSGDNIDQWVQFLTKVDVPRLKTLDICGVNQVRQELTHSTGSFVERMTGTSPPLELYLLNIQLQESERLGLFLSRICTLPCWGTSVSEGEATTSFKSAQDAVDLYFSKRRQWKKNSGDTILKKMIQRSMIKRKMIKRKNQWGEEQVGFLT